MAENKNKKKYNTGYGGNIFDSFPDFDSLESLPKKPAEKKATVETKAVKTKPDPVKAPAPESVAVTEEIPQKKAKIFPP